MMSRVIPFFILLLLASPLAVVADSSDSAIGCCVVTGSGEQTKALKCRAEISGLECRQAAGLIGGTPHIYTDDPTCSQQDTCFTGESEAIFVNTYIPGLTKKAPDPGSFGKEKYYVSGIPEYIKIIYNFIVAAVSFLAVIMITVGGFKWITAAGNPEKIGDARNTILNSVMGVVLALLSYTILNLINPNLTSFRQIRPLVVPNMASLQPECAAMKEDDNIQVAPVKAGGREREFNSINGSEYGSISSSPDTCGEQYYIKERGGTCRGTKCDTNKICLLDNNSYQCEEGMIGGNIRWEGNAYPDFIKLIPLCGSAEMMREGSRITGVIKDSSGSGSKVFSISTGNVDSYLRNVCTTQSLLGFILEVEINDDSGWWTNDDDFYIGKGSGCNSGPGIIRHAGFLSSEEAQSLRESQISIAFSADELKNGQQCDIYITRTNFPTQ